MVLHLVQNHDLTAWGRPGTVQTVPHDINILLQN